MLYAACSGTKHTPVVLSTAGQNKHHSAHTNSFYSLCRRCNQTVMAKATVAAWAACIKELQQQLDTAGAVRADAVPAFCQRLEKLNEQPTLPRAVWKKLVQDVQVKMLTREGCQACVACGGPTRLTATVCRSTHLGFI